MVGQSRNDKVVQVQNLTDYFRTSIDGVISRQGVDVDPHAAHYVVNLLTLFSRSEELYEDRGDSYGLRPLALMLAAGALHRLIGDSGASVVSRVMGMILASIAATNVLEGLKDYFPLYSKLLSILFEEGFELF